MKTLPIIAICALLSMICHLYLSQRSYSLSADKASPSSICHINSSLNCDSALSSPYSDFANLPLSNYGFAVNFIIAVLSLLLITKGGKNPRSETPKTKSTIAEKNVTAEFLNTTALIWPALGFFSILSASASLVMLTLSFFVLNMFCPLCIVLYILSFVIVFCTFLQGFTFGVFSHLKEKIKHKCSHKISIKHKEHSSQTESKKAQSPPHRFKESLNHWFSLSSTRGWLLGSGLVFMILSLLVHLVFIQVYDIKSIKKTVKFQVIDWLSAPKNKAGGQALLTNDLDKKQALLTITEFADFLCYHCRNAHYSLKALSLPHIRREYFSFPLDQCRSNSLSCLLTRAVYCAEEQNKGWILHDLIFEHQPLFLSLKNQQEKAMEELKNLSQNLINQAQWQQCIESPSAFDVQAEQIQAGKKRGITGTPSLFVNDKKINHRYLIKTLKAIYQHEQTKDEPQILQ